MKGNKNIGFGNSLKKKTTYIKKCNVFRYSLVFGNV